MLNHMLYQHLLPLCSKVEEELKGMEELGIIAEVNVPTPWCVGMVADPKKNGKV